VLYCSGCATVNVPNLGTQSVVIQDDERRLMNRAKEVREAIDQSGWIYDDQAISVYLNAFIPKLLPQGLKADEVDFVIKVIKDPALNAFSFPDGQIYVTTGILAVAENESQIATLLAHELTHVLHRHGLKSFRSLKNTTAWWESVGLFTGGLGMIVSELAKVSSVSGFSQGLETEADEAGFELLKKAGFDTAQSVKFFELMDHYYKDEKGTEPYFFSSHPKLVERIKNFKRLSGVQDVSETSETIDLHYQELFHELIVENLKLCLSSGMYKTVENQLSRLMKVYPQDAHLAFLKGELYRERHDPQEKRKDRDKDKDYAVSLESYDLALSLNNDYDEAELGKGRVLLIQGKKDEALRCLNQYLQKKSSADNKNLVEYLLKKAKSQP